MPPESTRARVASIVAAIVVLGAVRLGLAVLPFRTVSHLTERLARIGPALPTQPASRIGGRVMRAASYVPGAACLAQALAARVLLAWHGHASVVRYGLRTGAEGLVAHAWVEHDGVVVAGGPDVSGYVTMQSPRTPHAG